MGILFVVEDVELTVLVEGTNHPLELATNTTVPRANGGLIIKVLHRLNEGRDSTRADKLQLLHVHDDLGGGGIGFGPFSNLGQVFTKGECAFKINLPLDGNNHGVTVFNESSLHLSIPPK